MYTIAMIRVHVHFVCMKILVHISECEPLNDTTTSLQAMSQHAAWTNKITQVSDESSQNKT